MRYTVLWCVGIYVAVLCSAVFARAGQAVDLSGVVQQDGTPLNAMVLANGEYTFSAASDGAYSLADVPTDGEGKIVLHCFCAGKAPYTESFTPESGDEVRDITVCDLTGGEGTLAVDISYQRTGAVFTLSGTVLLGETPAAAMVLAGGEYAFSNGQDGAYSLNNVPTDGYGRIHMQVFCSGAEPYAQTIIPPLPWLTVQGTQIIDESVGLPINLRGTNIDMFYFAEPEHPETVWNYIDEWALDEFQKAGANHVRLCFHHNTLATLNPVQLRVGNQAKYKDIIEMCTKRGMYVLLDMHVPPGLQDLDQGSFWTDPQNSEDMLELWRLLALEFKDESGVLGYDIFNEPRPPNSDAWWNLVDKTVQTIRSVDTRHIIVVENPVSDSGDESFRKVDDPLILYSFHYYEPFLVSHRAADWSGDTAVPEDAVYPGWVLSDLEQMNHYTPPTKTITGTQGRSEVSTVNAVVPEGAGFASIAAYAQNGAMDVRFSEFTATKNGANVDLVNPNLSEASYRSNMPRAWFPEVQGGYTCSWEPDYQGAQGGALRITGSGETAWWHQLQWVGLTRPLIAVTPGDTLTVRATAESKNSTGMGAVSFIFFKPVYSYTDYNSIREHALKKYITPLKALNVPAHVGEFGSMARNEDASAQALVRDMIAIWNEFELPWTLWTARGTTGDANAFDFGIIRCNADNLPSDCKTFRNSIYIPWSEGLLQ